MTVLVSARENAGGVADTPVAGSGLVVYVNPDQIAQLRRLWESIELEIVRVLKAMNELRESPDYELYRLMERSPEFFDETVGRHLERTGGTAKRGGEAGRGD